ncbi:homoserine dehydrogenase [candidate division KSB1 bacterium]
MLKLLFVGFGNVGQACVQLLHDQKDILEKEYGFKYKIVGILDTVKGSVIDENGIDPVRVLDLAAKNLKLDEYAGGESFGDALEVIKKIDADVLLEATFTDIKTGEPATSYIKEAINRGMHIVTTNKGPLALFYKEIKALADKKGVKFLFEGTVVSGTPLLNLIRETLKGSGINSIQGILNGTTNYILTKMEEGMEYNAALKKAQELGYAEAVPDADVEGWDALAKATILANVVFDAGLKPDDIPCRGITKITAGDIENAKKEGKRYKLLAKVSNEGGVVKAEVSPQKIDLLHPLASVSGATNALTISSDALNDVTIIGPGAGRKETGFSMLIDLLAI